MYVIIQHMFCTLGQLKHLPGLTFASTFGPQKVGLAEKESSLAGNKYRVIRTPVTPL